MELVARYSKTGHPWEQLRRLVAKLPDQASDQQQHPTAAPPRPHKLERWLTAELAEQVVGDYRAGVSSSELTLKYQLGKSTVLRILRKADVRMRKQGFDERHLQEAAAAYERGKSLATIARRYGCGPEAVRKALVGSGVTIRARRGWSTEQHPKY